MDRAAALDTLRGWMVRRGMQPFGFQERAWAARAQERSGLVCVPTGAGKTYASYMGALADALSCEERSGGSIVYVTPLRAMSRDIELALREPIEELGLGLTVESRTGDTSSSMRARQRKRLPDVLITTPESLTLLMTYEDAPVRFARVRSVIVDEWHELLSSKRGTQVELALARLRRFTQNRVCAWALSATIGNLEDAALAVSGAGSSPLTIADELERPIHVRAVLPAWGGPECRLPWAGHLGRQMLPALLSVLDPARPTLVFCNTRAQAELWFQAIREARPGWASVMGLHHGSIDQAERESIEAGLKAGQFRLVVCTSSLDLGVDFGPIERVVQIGSVKGIARLIQRAGRSGHRPGTACEIDCVPTHGLELIEIAAARQAIQSGSIESREPFSKPLDVLAQHLVTCALGGGFRADELYQEVRTAVAYSTLTREEFDWALDLVENGGETLRAYPQFHKVVRGVGDEYGVIEREVQTQHRLNVGTITGSETLGVRFNNGRSLGHIEESFAAKLRPKEAFVFAGRKLRFHSIRDMTVLVTDGGDAKLFTPHWAGTRLPISDSLSVGVRETIERAGRGEIDSESEPELVEAEKLLRAQSAMSAIPAAGQVLVETLETSDGSHLCMYPFDGRLVHEAVGALLALRLGRKTPATFTVSANDYGFELLSAQPFEYRDTLTPELFSTQDLVPDILESVNLGQMAKRQFREVARVAGLVSTGYPGAHRRSKHMQASSSLIYEVLEEFDPENLLLSQARREVMDQQFEQTRLARSLLRVTQSPWVWKQLVSPSPMALPLSIERIAATVSTQTVLDRIELVKQSWEQHA